MLGREDAASGSHVALVVGDGASADDETSDVQVERLVLGGVLGSQRVEYKLEVGWAFGCLAVEVGRPKICADETEILPCVAAM